MKKKNKKLPFVIILLVGVILSSLYIGVTNILQNIFSPRSVQDFHYLYVQASATVMSCLLLCVFGYGSVLKEKGFVKKPFFKAIFIYILGVIGLILIYAKCVQPQLKVNSFPIICNFITLMFLIGCSEEICYRGLILNLLLEHLPDTKKSIDMAIILESVLFGSGHILKWISSGKIFNGLLQCFIATIFGIAISILYIRYKSIWTVILLHTAYDFSLYVFDGIFHMNRFNVLEELSMFRGIIAIVMFILSLGMTIWHFFIKKSNDIL